MSASAIRDPVGYARRTLGMYRELLFDPRTFYEKLGVHRIRREFLLVLVIGLVGSIGGYYTMSELTAVASISGESSTAFQLWRLAATPLLGAFGLWFGGTVAFYLISWYYTTTGSFFHLLKNTGWALFPFLFANALKAVGLVLTASGIPENPEWLSEFETLRQPSVKANFLWEQALNDPLLTGATVVSWVFVLWSGYIAASGVANVRALERDEAFRVVAVPVVLYLAYSAATLFGVV